MIPCKIAVLGDFNPNYATHLSLNESIAQCKEKVDAALQCDWISTELFNAEFIFSGIYSGLWIAPGSPYKNMKNVIDAIQYTRLHNIPTFGNCGGFQHMLIEIARNCCGIETADHEETNADAQELVISKLSCSLIGQEEKVFIKEKESIMYKILQQETIAGKYFCSYGLNKKYTLHFMEAGCNFTAFSEENEVRAFELKTHPFFLGTLFQPALTSTQNNPNAIITAFFRKCIEAL